MRGSRSRSACPAPAYMGRPWHSYPELWALLTVYNALVGLAVTTTVELNVDSDQVFTAVPAMTRDLILTALITSIAGQSLNRHDRQRTEPVRPRSI